ncbi:hypothetical protein [Niabella ginsengisoli]|uniref:Uncharacterized protein n=1 Tax=Niabella ginsengisoli TaxID=522298 RepID=A0ABS9SR01_9BACT|nr:hypothetical protein [Niabella ginsengisoli]MCH5600828.1 hypothetical protein [Niabella ginsengisoli]
MIDLPIFASLKTAVEKCLVAHPNLTIQDIKFEDAVAESTPDMIEATIYFKLIS